MNLMLNVINLKESYSARIDAPIKTHYGAIMKIVCGDLTPVCYLYKCSACPGTSALKDFITSVLSDQCIGGIEFQIWQQTDRGTLRTEIMDAEVYAERLCYYFHCRH